MHRSSLLALALLLLLTGSVTAQAATLEGRWLLVKQSYGKGNSNLVRDAAPLHLEFFREGGALTGWLRTGEERSEES